MAKRAAQDDVWVPIAFNRSGVATLPETATPLAAALVRFQAGFASLEPLFGLIASGDPRAFGLTAILADLVDDVAETLGLPTGTATRAAPDEPMDSYLTWVLRQADLSLNRLTVFGRAASDDAGAALRFPSIDGLSPVGTPRAAPAARSPDGQAGWMETDYAFPAVVPSQLILALPVPNVLIERTVTGGAWITRNVELGGAVNPAFVCRTPQSFSGIGSPTVHVTETLGPFDGSSVAQMLISALTPLTVAAETTHRADFVSILVTYRYPAAGPRDGAPLDLITVPVIKTGDMPLEPDPAPLAEACADAVAVWGRVNPLPRDGARLSVSLTLDAVLDPPGSEPTRVVTIDRLDLNLPAGWPGD
jgi:hypothetical protein